MRGAANPEKHSLFDLDWAPILDQIDVELPGFDLRAVYVQSIGENECRITAHRGFPNPGFASRLSFTYNVARHPLFELDQTLSLDETRFFSDHPFTPSAYHLFRYACGGKVPASSLFIPLVPDGSASRALVILDRFHPFINDVEKANALRVKLLDLIENQLRERTPEPASPTEPLRAINAVLQLDARQLPIEMTIEENLNKLAYLIDFDTVKVWHEPSREIKLTDSAVSTGAITFGRSIRDMIEHRQPLLENDSRMPKELSMLSDIGGTRLFIPLRVDSNSSVIMTLIRDHTKPFSEQDLLQADLFSKFFHATANANLAIEPSDHSKQQARHTAVIEAVFDGVLITDTVNKIQFINSALYELIGKTETAKNDPTIESFSSHFGNDLEGWKDHILTWSLNAKFEDPKSAYTDRIALKNGRVLLLHLSPILLGNDFLGTISIFRDVTYEHAFDRLKTDFITSISHELRTPLTSIAGYVDLLLMGAAGGLTDEQRAFMSIIKNNSGKLNNLINDLLELTTIEAGNYQLRAKPFDIVSVAREITRKVERANLNRSKSVQINFEHSPNLPLVYANLDRSSQIIENLISNACAYSAEHGVVNVFIREMESYLQLSVHNQNVVVPPEHEAIIFDKFYKGDDPTVQILQGSGLGLPIIKQLVELQKGRIWVSNDQNTQGSTFAFTLPIWNEGAEDG